MNYSINDEHGGELVAGLEGYEHARDVASKLAAERQAPVTLIPGYTTPAGAYTGETILPPLVLEWGSWPVPASAPVAWGARAIYRIDTTDTKHRMVGGRKKLVQRASTTATIDLLWDRQGSAARDGVTDAERKALADWINKVGMPELRKQCARRYITPDCDETIEIERDGYALKAGPRESHGYLYIRAWKVGA